MTDKNAPAEQKVGAVQVDATPAQNPTPDLNIQRVVKDADGDGRADTGPSTEVDVYEVTIERDQHTKIPTEVFEYEIPVLEYIHGDRLIRDEDAEPIFSAMVSGTAADVLASLRSKYNNIHTGDVVAQVYRDADELASKAKLPAAGGKKAKKLPQSENVDNRKTAAAKAK